MARKKSRNPMPKADRKRMSSLKRRIDKRNHTMRLYNLATMNLQSERVKLIRRAKGYGMF